jgi:hypothetical protein
LVGFVVDLHEVSSARRFHIPFCGVSMFTAKAYTGFFARVEEP